MMRALFVSLSASLLAGCVVSSAGESAAEDLVPEDVVAQSEQATRSAAQFECPGENCDKALPSAEPWWIIKRRTLQAPHDVTSADAAGETAGADAAEESEDTFHPIPLGLL
jgi:hypothetical protein